MRTRFLVSAGLVLACLGVVSLSAQRPADQPKPAPTTTQDRGPVKAISDGWITMKIHSQFVPEDALEGSDIDVDTRNGVVTLTGTVPTAAAKSRAAAIAKATDGVKSVVDQLHIAAAAPGGGVSGAVRDAGRDTTNAAKKAGRSVNDGWIKSKIYSQFLTENALDDSHIDIDVKNGVVTLNGTVKSEAGRSRAVVVAKATDGVKSVNDSLTIR